MHGIDGKTEARQRTRGVELGFLWPRSGAVSLTAIQSPGRFDRQGTSTVAYVSVSMSVASGYRDHGTSRHGSVITARPVTVS